MEPLERWSWYARRGCAIVVSGAFATAALAGPPVTQLAGQSACVADAGGPGGCADGRALQGPAAVATSPDGRHLYAASLEGGAIVVFDRAPLSGAIVQKAGADGCIAAAAAEQCAVGTLLAGPIQLAVSPDGRNVYVAAALADGVAVFDRDPLAGTLAQKAGSEACISETGTMPTCADGKALEVPVGIAVSPDGANVYVASGASGAVAVLDRDPQTGVVTQQAGLAGCVSEDGSGGDCADGAGLLGANAVAVSPDGASVYVASRSGDAVAVLDRDPVTGELTQKAGTAGCISESGSAPCADGRGLDGAIALGVSADGKSVYVGSIDSAAIAVFDRDPATGALTQKMGAAGCISATGSGGECATRALLEGLGALWVSSDGTSVYAAGRLGDALVIFERSTTDGSLEPKPGTVGCWSETGSSGACADGLGLDQPFGVTESPDGRNLYVAAQTSDAVAVFHRGTRLYDVEGDGAAEALTDGLLMLRYFFGLRGAALVASAVDLASCRRCTMETIEDFIEELYTP